jgi:hypothetical protein
MSSEALTIQTANSQAIADEIDKSTSGPAIRIALADGPQVSDQKPFTRVNRKAADLLCPIHIGSGPETFFLLTVLLHDSTVT